MLSSQAHADWAYTGPTYEGTYNEFVGANSSTNNTRSSITAGYAGQDPVPLGGGQGTGNPGDTVGITTNGQCTVHLHYKWNGPGTPTPLIVRVEVTPAASARSRVSVTDPDFPATEHVSVSVTAGGTTASDPSGTRVASYKPGVLMTRATTNLKALVTLSSGGPGSPIDVDLPIGYSASATLDGGRFKAVPNNPKGQPVLGDVGAGWNGQVVRDNRAVRLTRNVGNDSHGIPLEYTTYFGGGTITYGDTTYSYHSRLTGLEPAPDDVWNQQTIYATINGDWSKTLGLYNVTRRWVIPTNFLTNVTSETLNSLSGQTRMSSGMEKFATNWVGAPANDEDSVIKFFVRDNVDGSQSAPRYVLRLHDPVDGVSTSVTGLDVTCGFLDVNGQPVVVDHANSLGNPTLNGTVGKSSGWSISGSIGEIEGFKNPLGLDVGYSYSTDTGTEKAITLDKVAQPVALNMERQVMITYKYNRHHSFFDRWNEKGKVRRYAYAGTPTTAPPTMEVQHEGFSDEYKTSSLSFGDPYNPDKVGHAPASTVTPPLPPAVSTFKS